MLSARLISINLSHDKDLSILLVLSVPSKHFNLIMWSTVCGTTNLFGE